MKLYLVRHGQTAYNAGNVTQGDTDIPLNDVGIAQAHELAKVVQDMKFDAYYVSPLRRAQQTAEIITNGKAEFTINSLLRERSFGSLEGKHIDWANYGDIFDRRINYGEYGIEPIKDLLSRAKEFLNYLKSTHDPSDEILIVAHGGLLRAIHFNIVGYDDNTDFLTVRFQNCEMREYEI